MPDNRNGSSREGLERSCIGPSSDWIRHTDATRGVELLEARFQGPAYAKHRHDTYAIGVTESGVQAFSYRGAVHVSLPGQISVLHPDEQHDGYAGSDSGFSYQLLFIEPALIFEAAHPISPVVRSLPFARQPVITSSTFAAAIRAAFESNREPLAIDELPVHLAGELIKADCNWSDPRPLRRLNVAAIERAREYLDTETCRAVRSSELEKIAELSRCDLARQFRAMLGTSPYRYSVMRRLDFARLRMKQCRPLVDVALDAGFADQAHFTRMFVKAYGVTPARYVELQAMPANGEIRLDQRSKRRGGSPATM